MRSTWTDSRLDDFADETGRRFDRVEQRMDAGFNALRGEISDVRSEISGVRSEISGVRTEVMALHHVIVRGCFGVTAAVIAVAVTQLF